MYKLKMFDNKWLKEIGYLRRHLFLIAIVEILLVMLLSKVHQPILLVMAIWLAIILFVITWFYTNKYSLQNLFMSANELRYYFEGARNTWKFVGPQYLSMNRSTFMGIKEYGLYGSSLINFPLKQDQFIPLAFVADSGCVAWVELNRNFPHLVVDSLKDRHTLQRLFQKNPLPPTELELEGNFPELFSVYQEPSQQIVTLQILSPDRMSFLAHDMKNINLEIQDNYLRLYSANAQRSSQDFKLFLDAIAMMHKGLKTDKISSIR